MSTTTTRRRNARKIVGTVAVVGAAAAAAGLGTFGSFTDSTAADAAVATGVLSIDVSAAGSSAPVPYTSANLLPGDSGSMLMDLRNGGDVSLSSLVLGSRATTSSALDTDRVNGLQLKVESCGTPWAGSAGSYTCAAGDIDLYSGPIVVNQALPTARSLAAGATDHLLVTVSFPGGAGNQLKNNSSTLEFVFTGTQRDGGNR